MVAESQNMVSNLGFSIEEDGERKAVIKVIGVGGAGGNAVNHMVKNNIKGVECISANTDQQALNASLAHHKISLGQTGLGAGAKPEKGRESAEAARESIRNALAGADMVFIAAGMGGGTGTGASPVVAEIARELDILTVGIVSKPFQYEGTKRMRNADAGIAELGKHVNALIVVLNDQLEDLVGDDATHADCLSAADDVLYNSCAGISEIISVNGNINVDFEDVRTVMTFPGQAMMGTATASGSDRAKRAAEEAVACPLLEGVDLNGARGLVINITARKDGLGQKETRIINQIIADYAHKDAEIVSGVAYDDSMEDNIRVTVIASGLGRSHPEVVVDNSNEMEAVRTGTDDVRAHGGQNVSSFISTRGGSRGTRLNSGFGVGSTKSTSTDSPSTERRPLKSDERDDIDVPAFLRKQAN